MKVSELLALNLPIFHKAYAIASEAHKNDRRKYGEKAPYMTHVDAVIEGTAKWLIEHIDEESGSFDPTDTETDYYIPFQGFVSVAALHDVIEDHGDIYSFDSIRDEFLHDFDDYSMRSFIQALKAVTKDPTDQEKYIDYIKRILDCDTAIIVKIADLEHNMSDLSPSDKLDKYQMAHYVLKNKLDEYI